MVHNYKISNPYTTKYVFYEVLFLCVIYYDIFELWRHKP